MVWSELRQRSLGLPQSTTMTAEAAAKSELTGLLRELEEEERLELEDSTEEAVLLMKNMTH